MSGHVFYKFYYHLIWGTKNRLPLITPKIEELLIRYFPVKTKETGGELIEFNSVEDHVHSLLTIPPAVSISEFVHKIKGSSSHFVNNELEGKELYWQEGYGVLTLSEKDIPFIRNYIKNQKTHHREKSIIENLEIISEDR